jgi:DNA-binding MarR family transcriptional regulator
MSSSAAAGDRRACRVALTEKGRSAFAQWASSHHVWLKAMLAGIDPDRQMLLFELLGELRASIDAEPTKDDL